MSAALNRSVTLGPLRRSYLLQLVKTRTMRATSDRRMNPVFPMMDPEHPDRMRLLSAVRSELQRWKDLAARNRFDLLVIMVPDVYQVSSGRRASQAEYYGLAEHSLDPLLPNRSLAELLVEQHIGYVDATSELMARSDIECLYYVHDNHLTAGGHRVFADLVRNKVLAAVENAQRAPP